jgi:hypothetical protein
LDKRFVLDKVLKVLEMSNSCEGKKAFMITPEIVKEFEALEDSVYLAYASKGKSKRTKQLSASNVVDMLNLVFSNWANIEIESTNKKVSIGDGKRALQYTVTIPTNDWFKYITDKELNVITFVE